MCNAWLTGLSHAEPVIPVSDDEFSGSTTSHLVMTRCQSTPLPTCTVAATLRSMARSPASFCSVVLLLVHLECTAKKNFVTDPSVVALVARRSRPPPLTNQTNALGHRPCMAPSLNLPCCRLRMHCDGLARSVRSCCDHPFCTRDLRSPDAIPLKSRSTTCILPFDHNAAPYNAAIGSLNVPSSLPTAPQIWPLCCFRSSDPPVFDHCPWSLRLGSSVDLPVLRFVHLHGGRSTCGRGARPLCSALPGVVFDRPSGRAVLFCIPCEREVPRGSSVVLRPHCPRSPHLTTPLLYSRTALSRGLSHSSAGLVTHTFRSWPPVVDFLPIDLSGTRPCRITTWSASPFDSWL